MNIRPVRRRAAEADVACKCGRPDWLRPCPDIIKMKTVFQVRLADIDLLRKLHISPRTVLYDRSVLAVMMVAVRMMAGG